MNTRKIYCAGSIAALRGTCFLAYPIGMSRRSVPCALHSNRSLRFFEVLK